MQQSGDWKAVPRTKDQKPRQSKSGRALAPRPGKGGRATEKKRDVRAQVGAGPISATLRRTEDKAQTRQRLRRAQAARPRRAPPLRKRRGKKATPGGTAVSRARGREAGAGKLKSQRPQRRVRGGARVKGARSTIIQSRTKPECQTRGRITDTARQRNRWLKWAEADVRGRHGDLA